MSPEDDGIAGSPWRIHWPGLAAAAVRELVAETIRTIRITTRTIWRNQ